jgi:hypothetical protein
MAIKLSDSEIRFFTLLLRLIDLAPAKRMSEAQIIYLGEKSDWLTHVERASVRSRSDSRFANQIHNVVSHRDSKRNPIHGGLIEWEHHTSVFALTEKGRKFLDDVAAKLGSSKPDDYSAIDDWLRQWANSQNKSGG